MESRIESYVDALCRELEVSSSRLQVPSFSEPRLVGTEAARPGPGRNNPGGAITAVGDPSVAPSLPRSLAPSSRGLTRADLRPTIFLGGGTPTMLSLRQMERVLQAADTIVPLAGAEVTTEANPGTVIDEDYLRGLRSLGINRISFGVQSLHDPTLRVLGRIHTAAEALATYEQALRAGFSAINLDLIFGLPGQTAEQWAWTLDRLVELDPQHVSLYSLIVEPGTPLHQQVTRGSITVPDDDAAADMYELAMEKLAVAGYEHYEISNWARQASQANQQTNKPSRTKNEEPSLPFSMLNSHFSIPAGASRHNAAYWLNADYLGCGAGAHGHVYPRRYHNILGVDDYIARAQQGALPIAETVELSENDLFAETMMMGLRLTPGVSRAHFVDRCGHELDDVYGDVVAELVGLDLLHADELGVRLTPRGRMLGNNVFMRFLKDD